MTYQNPPPSNAKVIVNHMVSNEWGESASFEGQTFSPHPYLVKTNIFISGYTFSDPSARLALTWQLTSPDGFDTDISSNETATIFIMTFLAQSAAYSDYNGLSFVFNNQAIVDGNSVSVDVVFNLTNFQFTVIFPHFVDSVLYDPVIGFTDPSSSSSSSSDDYHCYSEYGCNQGDGVIVGSVVGGVLGTMGFVVFAALLGTGLLVCIIVCQSIRKEKKEKYEQAERSKSLKKKEVETLWSLAEGHTRDGKKIFKAEKEPEEEEATDEEMGWGTKLKNMAPHRKNEKAKYYLEFLPPETVELIAGFVEGKPQHTIG